MTIYSFIRSNGGNYMYIELEMEIPLSKTHYINIRFGWKELEAHQLKSYNYDIVSR